MSNNIGKIKFILSLLAVTSVAALNPSAYAQNVKPGNVDGFLNRANLNTVSPQLQLRENNNLPASVQKLPNGFKPGSSIDKCDGGGSTNFICGKKPQTENQLRTNPVNSNGSLLNRSVPQIPRQ